ncbi:MAG: hypothetical protein CMA63_06230 [Euryarchaeota archaeon]|mgnify:FL=1|jgi:Holliday junction resolvase RusA-like endonuclease|nr:hypothetical protein [Euryarchaeota archaeon]|tara:strand:+ start:13617 stop:14075 length:459 start_codon:yes stop_codon:yes gene_type:complete
MYRPQGEIVVPVQPITKPVWKSVGRYGGHWGSKTYQKFLKEIGNPLKKAVGDTDILWEPIEVWLDIRPKRPKKSKFPFPQGDVDNFSKSILDACTEILWIDDWQVTDEHIHKEWAKSKENGYFKVKWKVMPMDHDQFTIFNERRIQWELANG